MEVCRSEVHAAQDAMSADVTGRAGDDVRVTGDYFCLCCQRRRLFVEGDWFVGCECHPGATHWAFWWN